MEVKNIMLFELNNDYDMNLDYFNLNNLDDYKKINYNKPNYNKTDMNNKIDLENGYYLGNLFTNTYDPYKNYKPKKILRQVKNKVIYITIISMKLIFLDILKKVIQ